MKKLKFDIQRFVDIYNENSNTLISGTSGDDYFLIFVNNGDNVTIDTGNGNDTICDLNNEDKGEGVQYLLGAGDDSIRSLVRYAKINGGVGNDYLWNNGGDYVTINGEDGNDTIENDGAFSSVDGGTGNDFILNHLYSNSATIDAGDGDDTIENGGEKVTINGGTGNDSIYNVEDNVTIYGGAGNDTVANYYGEGSKIYGNDGDDNIENLSYSVTIDAGSGNDSIKNSRGYYSEIKGGNGDDSIYNHDAIVTIDGGAGNDFILNDSAYCSISGGDGNDIIKNSGVSYALIMNGGLGDDLIENINGEASEIIGGQGKDSIYNSAYSVTINGGAGNDLISVASEDSNNLIQYANGDGNDTIYGINEDDTLQITGAKYSTTKSGDDLKVNVGSGSILLKDAANISLHIVTVESGGSGGSEDTTPADTLPVGISIKNSVLTASTKFTGKSINVADYEDVKTINAAAISQAVTIFGSDSDDSIKGGKGADTINGGIGKNTLTGGKGKDVFVYAGGNDLITDYKVGEDKIQINFADVTKSSVKGSDVILTTADGTISIKGAKDKVVTFVDEDGANTDLIFYNNISYAPLETGLSYDAKRTVLTASTKFKGNEIDLSDYLSSVTKLNAAALSKNISIIGTADNNSLKGGKGADTIFGGSGKNTLTGGAGKDIFVYNGGNDLITDYKVGEDKIQLNLADVTKTSVKSSDVILTTAEGTISVKGAKDKVVTFTDDSGTNTDLIFYSNISYAPLETGLTYDAKRTVLTASTKFKGTEIDLSDYLSSVTKLNAAALSKNISIIGTADNNSLKGGKGADTIFGGSGKNTLTGGAGKDIFVYAGGNDLITDYKPSEDKIQLNFADVTKSSVKGSDVILTTAQGTISVKGAKDKVVTFTDDSGATTDLIFYNNISYVPLETGLTYDAKRTVLTASTKFTGTKIDLSDYLSSVTKVNAAALSKNVSIIGTAANNSIKGGKGADTLLGGNGNDTLTGGAGEDVFVYDGGKDVITDYKAGEDSIKISGAITKTSYSGKDVVFTVGSGTLTVQKAKDKEIYVTDSSGTKSYSQTLDLLYDDNFVTDEFELDSITEEKFEVQNIETQNYNLAQDETILTYGKDK